MSIARAGEHQDLKPEMLTELCDSVEQELQEQQFFSSKLQASTVIVEVATSVLARFDRNVALQYVNHAYSNKPPLELIRQLVGADNTD